jgi:CheY-like chemotaxis protein
VEPTVLIIEDDLLIVKMVGLQLKQAGYQVLTAANGFQGLRMARSEAPDLILLDLMLPGLDGFEVLNQLRSDPLIADLPVVIISAKAGQADMEMASRIGANGYLVKPFRAAELLSIIRSLLSEEEEEAARHGTGVVLAGARGGEAGPVLVNVGVRLAQSGQPTTIVDFHPFSAEHSLLLGLPPRPSPALVAAPGAPAGLDDLIQRHPSGLRLLNNLEGGAAAGQLAPEDARFVLDTLLAREGIVLADVPVYPAAVLLQAASRCARVLLVTQSDPVALGAGQAALTMMQRVGLDMDQVGLVLVGPEAGEEGAALGRPIIAQMNDGAELDGPACRSLAGWIQNLT